MTIDVQALVEKTIADSRTLGHRLVATAAILNSIGAPPIAAGVGNLPTCASLSVLPLHWPRVRNHYAGRDEATESAIITRDRKIDTWFQLDRIAIFCEITERDVPTMEWRRLVALATRAVRHLNEERAA